MNNSTKNTLICTIYKDHKNHKSYRGFHLCSSRDTVSIATTLVRFGYCTFVLFLALLAITTTRRLSHSKKILPSIYWKYLYKYIIIVTQSKQKWSWVLWCLFYKAFIIRWYHVQTPPGGLLPRDFLMARTNETVSKAPGCLTMMQDLGNRICGWYNS